MRWLPIGVLGVHAVIHLMGFFKAFGYAELARLTHPISPPWGVAWLVAAGLTATTAAMLGAASRNYWVVGAVAFVVSQAVAFSAWQDAWAGTAANVILLLVVAHGLLTKGLGASTRAICGPRMRVSRARSRLPSSRRPIWPGFPNPCSDTFA